MDIQDEEFDYIDSVEPNFVDEEIDPYPGADCARCNVFTLTDTLELYQGKNIVTITKNDAEKFIAFFKEQD